jgi:hypothetical protein
MGGDFAKSLSLSAGKSLTSRNYKSQTVAKLLQEGYDEIEKERYRELVRTTRA